MKSICCFIVLALSLLANAQQSKVQKSLRLSRIFSDHMVLQQKQKVDVWGQAVAGQKLTVSANWGATVSTIADANGNWKIKFATP